MESKENRNFFQFLAIILSYRKLIILVTFTASILTVIYVLIIPQYWTSQAVIMPVESQNVGFSLKSTLLGAGASFLGYELEGAANNYISIMESRTFAKRVIKEFDLHSYYEISTDDSLKAFGDIYEFMKRDIKIGFNPKYSTIGISVTTKDKYLSAEIANYYWQELERYNQFDHMTKGKQKRQFLEARVAEIDSSLVRALEEITKFKNQNNIIDLDTQTVELMKIYADLLKQQLTAEMELEINTINLPSDSPTLKNLQEKLKIVQKKIFEIEQKGIDQNYKYLIDLGNISQLSSEYAKLELSVLTNKTIYEFLYPQLEGARIEELKDLPTIEIIDEAMPAGYRSKPQRARTCILIFFISLITSILAAVAINEIKKFKQ